MGGVALAGKVALAKSRIERAIGMRRRIPWQRGRCLPQSGHRAKLTACRAIAIAGAESLRITVAERTRVIGVDVRIGMRRRLAVTAPGQPAELQVLVAGVEPIFVTVNVAVGKR